ncbi:MAG: RdgB/HAM1 family non-canonical purine NTP pyrophosphatase [Bacteroidota bacterium]|nr:RdgB/HAM1 family non-canonical purine NTP pyrophosphatase [Bacteroidota bacterium]
MGWHLVVATNNRHKLVELQEIAQALAPDQLHFLPPETVLGTPWASVEESGTTLEENAYLKAVALFERVGQPVVADDSGLEVEALGGRPGVDSAHFAGSDAENRRALLDLLRDVPPERRRARFRTVLCYRDWLRTVCVEGIVTGWIALEERGEHGFGYDSLFIPDGEELTFAEMEPSQKNRISHRFRAVAALLKFLQRLEIEPEPTPGTSVGLVRLPPWLPWLLRVCGAAVRSDHAEQLGLAVEGALRAGMPVRALAEGLLQLWPFAGFPAAIEALQCAHSVCRRLGLAWQPPERLVQDDFGRREHGESLFVSVYRGQAERVRERLRELSPVLEDAVLRGAYGETLSREGLTLLERELAAVAMLVVGGWWRQAQSHLRALLSQGITPEQGEELLLVLRPLCSARQWERLQEEWQQAKLQYEREDASTPGAVSLT